MRTVECLIDGYLVEARVDDNNLDRPQTFELIDFTVTDDDNIDVTYEMKSKLESRLTEYISNLIE